MALPESILTLSRPAIWTNPLPPMTAFVPGLDIAEEQWQRATQGLYASGCTGFFATLITTSPERYRHLLTKWTACLQQNPRNGLGIHLEGPWLNPEPGYRGAHPPHFMTEPSLDQVRQWLDISGGALRMITLAPEVNPHAAEKAIEFLRAHGITCFVGHSGAMGDVLRGAVTAGAQGWTHLGNAAPRNPDKFDNVILHVLAESALYASLIPDGLHVPEHAFRALSWSLGDQLLLTTDAMAAAGVDFHNAHEQFTLGETVVQLGADGSARLPDSGRLAGSTLTPFEGVIRASAMSRLPMAHIWNIYSLRIANLLGFQHGLQEGLSADFCLFSWNEKPELWATYHRGRQEFCNGINWA